MRWLSPPDSVPEARDEREVVEADVEQEGEALADLLEDAAGDLVLLGVQRLRHGLEPCAGALHRHLGDVADMLAADLDAERLGLEPKAVAGLAGHVVEILRQLLARPLALGLAIAAVDVGDDALERLLGVVGADAVLVGELDLVLAGAMEDRVLRLLGQILPFGGQRELVVLAERSQRLNVIGRRGLGPGRDRALADGELLVGDDEVFVDMLLDAEAAAGGAGAIGIVEREQPGSISGMVKPETGQANFSENSMRSGPLLSWIFAVFFFSFSSAGARPPARRRIR